MPGSEALQRDAELLFEVVREAGQLALTLLRQQVRRWSKSDGTPVTEADIRVDALLRSKLQARRPAYGWLSEETPDDRQRLACDRMWIADPIDGTRDFIAGGTNWCIAVALIAEGSVGHKNDWDLAAGDLLVAEAGGCAVDVAGKPYIYNREATWQQGMIATGQARRVALTEALRKP
ncbi:MAG: hypothetical protein HY245_01740 [Rhizobiales bacterium]|nr:hypothetical protein [Hyphomicrobiales bacterium]